MTAEVDPVPLAPPQPWGYLASFLWVLLATLLSLILSIVVMDLWNRDQLDTLTADPINNGPLLAAVTLVSTVVNIVVFSVAANRAHWRVSEYLGWIVPDLRVSVTAFIVLAVLVVGYDALTYVLGRDVVSSFQLNTYRTSAEAGQLLELWLTVVIVAPLGEELTFRGFLYRGWARTPRDTVLAIVAISAFWASIHLQYDWFGMLQIFLIGLVLGWARWRSGSTLLTFVLHGFVNTWATLETLSAVQ